MQTAYLIILCCALAAAQNPQEYLVAENASEYLNHNPGGAVPIGVASLNTSGFRDPVVHPSRGGLSICVSGIVGVQAAALNTNFQMEAPVNQSQVTDLMLDLVLPGSNLTQRMAGVKRQVGGTYDIGATLCTPANNTSPLGVQLLTHGLGFDRRYWDFAPGYSYVDVATQFNWATFFYDRLGNGASSKADPVSEVQLALQAEIANVLALKLRSGGLGDISFSKVAGIGHSYGSLVTHALANIHPSSLDAAILTGFSTNTEALPIFLQSLSLEIASQNAPYRFTNLASGYLTPGSTTAMQAAFFRSVGGQGYDPSVVDMATAQKGTITVGELLTLTSPVEPAKVFNGTAAVVNGQEDLPYCYGNCSIPDAEMDIANRSVSALFPASRVAKSTGFYLALTSGHALNLHYRSSAAAAFVQRFLFTYAHYDVQGVPLCKYLSNCQPAELFYDGPIPGALANVSGAAEAQSQYLRTHQPQPTGT